MEHCLLPRETGCRSWAIWSVKSALLLYGLLAAFAFLALFLETNLPPLLPHFFQRHSPLRHNELPQPSTPLLSAKDIDLLLFSQLPYATPRQGCNKAVVIYQQLPADNKGGSWRQIASEHSIQRVVLQTPINNKMKFVANLWRGMLATDRLKDHRAFPQVLGWCWDEVGGLSGHTEQICDQKAINSLVQKNITKIQPTLMVVNEFVGDENYMNFKWPEIAASYRQQNTTMNVTGCAACDVAAGATSGSSWICRMVWIFREILSLLLFVTETKGAALLSFETVQLRLSPSTCAVFLVDNDHVYFPDWPPELLSQCFQYHNMFRQKLCATIEWCALSKECTKFQSHYNASQHGPLIHCRVHSLRILSVLMKTASNAMKNSFESSRLKTCTGCEAVMAQWLKLHALVSKSARQMTISSNEMFDILHECAAGLDDMLMQFLPEVKPII